MNLHNQLMDILNFTLEHPHELCTNDCNMLVMRVIDLFAGTTISHREYRTIKEGIEGLKNNGWNHTGEIVLQYCNEVTHTIDGDIWLDPENPLIMGVVVSGRFIGCNENHDGFILINKPTEGKYYRVRKQ